MALCHRLAAGLPTRPCSGASSASAAHKATRDRGSRQPQNMQTYNVQMYHCVR